MEATLIELIKAHPALYNPTTIDYKDHVKKENAWLTIAETLKRPVDDCQRRWKNLRDRFNKERRLLKTNLGSDKTDYSCRWQYYTAMSFFAEYLKPRKSFANIDGSYSDIKISAAESPSSVTAEEPVLPVTVQYDNWDSNSSSSVNTEIALPKAETSRPKKPKPDHSEDLLDKAILKYLKSQRTNEDEEYYFAMSVAATLRRLAPRARSLAKAQIQKILADVEFSEKN